jgi:hypothetical protein
MASSYDIVGVVPGQDLNHVHTAIKTPTGQTISSAILTLKDKEGGTTLYTKNATVNGASLTFAFTDTETGTLSNTTTSYVYSIRCTTNTGDFYFEVPIGRFFVSAKV